MQGVKAKHTAQKLGQIKISQYAGSPPTPLGYRLGVPSLPIHSNLHSQYHPPQLFLQSLAKTQYSNTPRVGFLPPLTKRGIFISLVPTIDIVKSEMVLPWTSGC